MAPKMNRTGPKTEKLPSSCPFLDSLGYPVFAIGVAFATKKRAVAAALSITTISCQNFYCEERNWFIADLKIS